MKITLTKKSTIKKFNYLLPNGAYSTTYFFGMASQFGAGLNACPKQSFYVRTLNFSTLHSK
jgi:hypothetical protein